MTDDERRADLIIQLEQAQRRALEGHGDVDRVLLGGRMEEISLPRGKGWRAAAAELIAAGLVERLEPGKIAPAGRAPPGAPVFFTGQWVFEVELGAGVVTQTTRYTAKVVFPDSEFRSRVLPHAGLGFESLTTGTSPA